MRRVYPLLAVLVVALGVAYLALPAERAARLYTQALGAACIRLSSIDTAPEPPITGPQLSVEGWAYHWRGVRAVQAVRGDELLAEAPADTVREDVRASHGRCPGIERSGFHLAIPAARLGDPGAAIDIRMVDGAGATHHLGRVKPSGNSPLGYLDDTSTIEWNGANVIRGWAFARDGDVTVKVLAQDREIAAQPADGPRSDVAEAFPGWRHAGRSGFAIPLAMHNLPRGRYALKIRFESSSGNGVERVGPQVENDLPIGRTYAKADRIVDGAPFHLRVWAHDEQGVVKAELETETGLALGAMTPLYSSISLLEFEKPHSDPADAKGNESLMGSAYETLVQPERLPAGLHRLTVRVTDGSGKQQRMAGPIVYRPAEAVADCPGESVHVFLPGDGSIFAHGFPQLDSLRGILDRGCVSVGLRSRVEYLRTTRGKHGDFVFDADFSPPAGRHMTGVPLRVLLDLAVRRRAPLLISLDGGVWADAAFPMPDHDVVDVLEQDPLTVQWNQHGRPEEDDALSELPGSYDSPQLARMMSLNRFNERFLAYKKRNLQAAVREIVRFMKQHPDLYVAVNLDPDQYINPWFYLQQWYDYNPDTLREFREWIFHRGPYADGGSLASARYPERLTLARVAELSGRSFANEADVEPPRDTLDYASPWHQIWTGFKRHLVARHYELLAAWAAEAGMPEDRIYTSQTFIQTEVALDEHERATGWTDEAGVSIKGAKPTRGHLGAILYGPASRNQGTTRSGASLIDNIRTVDPHWGSGEFHPANISEPHRQPSHRDAYLTMLTMGNGGARYFSPMWGSRGQEQLVRPERFRSYDSFDGTPFEYQMLRWFLDWGAQPAGSMMFPFGNELVDSDDGWSATAPAVMEAGRGKLILRGETIRMESPRWEGFRPGSSVTVWIRGDWRGRDLAVKADTGAATNAECTAIEAGRTARCELSLAPGKFLTQLRLEWTAGTAGAPAILDDVRIVADARLQ